MYKHIVKFISENLKKVLCNKKLCMDVYYVMYPHSFLFETRTQIQILEVLCFSFKLIRMINLNIDKTKALVYCGHI